MTLLLISGHESSDNSTRKTVEVLHYFSHLASQSLLSIVHNSIIYFTLIIGFYCYKIPLPIIYLDNYFRGQEYTLAPQVLLISVFTILQHRDI